MNNIVIIGNGAAANSAAEAIRQHNKRIPITMLAREKLPLYSACALPDCLSGWVKRSQVFLKNMQDYEQMRVETRFGQEVNRISPAESCIYIGEERLNYHRLILATGSRPLIPPVPGSLLPGNFVLKTISDVDAIQAHQPRQAVIVGSGNIGVEAAEALQMQGCQVTVVEMQERIMPRIFDETAARRIAQIMREHGIQILNGEKVIEMQGAERVEAAVTDNRTIPCDTVIWAAGVRQNVELAIAAGIDIGELGGIQVDSCLQTSIAGIYACGDCIESRDLLNGEPGLSLLWPNARRQGQVAGMNAIGQETYYEGSFSLVVEDVYGTTAVSMGMIAADFKNKDIRIMEGEESGQYWRIILRDERIAGMQALGISVGLGAIMSLMKKGCTVGEFHTMLEDPAMARSLAWYLPAQRFMSQPAGAL